MDLCPTAVLAYFVAVLASSVLLSVLVAVVCFEIVGYEAGKYIFPRLPQVIFFAVTAPPYQKFPALFADCFAHVQDFIHEVKITPSALALMAF